MDQQKRFSNARLQIMDSRNFALLLIPKRGQGDFNEIAHLLGVDE